MGGFEMGESLTATLVSFLSFVLGFWSSGWIDWFGWAGE